MMMHRHTQQPGHDAQTPSDELDLSISGPQHVYPNLNDGGDKTGHRNQLYRPIWLAPHFLIALSVIFTASWVTLVVLFRVVSSQDGLSFTITSSHYAWTYGPSTVLIVLLGVWRQVDYHCKLTQPWRQMMSAPSHPDRSVLLDYVSPMQVVAFARSLDRKHFPVALSVAGFGVLKIAILLSTTLFVPEQTLHSEQRSVQYESSFDASDLWTDLPGRDWTGWQAGGGYSGFLPPDGNYTNSANALIWGYVKQLNGQTLDPTKVMDNMVYQSFDVLGSNDNITSTTAEVDVFQPNIICEDGEVDTTMSPGQAEGDLFMSLTIRSKTCSAEFPEWRLITPVRDEPILYDMKIFNCSAAGDNTDTRIVLTALDISPTQLSNGSYSDVTVNKGTSVVCKVDFASGKAESTQSPLGNPVGLTQFRPEPAAIDLDSTQLAMLIYASLYRGNRIQIEEDLPMGSASGFSGAWPGTFLLMRKSMGSNSGWDDLFDQRKLSEAATSVFEGLTVHLGLTHLLQPANADSGLGGTGMVTISQNKLHLRKEPLFLMTACFIVLAFISTATLLLVRKRVVPQRLGSIASHATILATSPSVMSALHGTGHLRTSQLRTKLEDLRFQVTLSNDKYSIEATNPANVPGPEVSYTPGKQEKANDWTPFAIRIPMLLTLFLFPCAVIAALESLQRVSDANNGVVDLSDSGNSATIIFAARLCSTLVIFGVAMLFNNMDFVITTFTPFSALRCGGVTARQASMSANLVGETPVLALYKSLRYRYFGTALSLIAALLGSLLTIMVSGLWTVDSQVMLPTALTAEASSWNLAWFNNSANDNGAARLLNTIDFNGTTVPTAIWDGHVLPKIMSWSSAATSEDSANNSPLSDFKLKVPSLRPVLDCIAATPEDITHKNTSMVLDTSRGPSGQNRTVPARNVQARFDLPSGCLANPSRNSSNVILEYTLVTTARSSMLGRIFDLDTGPKDGGSIQLPNETGCPSLGVLFGDIESPTALLCSQRIQIVELEANYLGDPSLDNRDSRPPSYSLIEDGSASTPIFATDPDSGLPTFQYRIYQHLNADLSQINQTSDPSVDEAFNHLFYGPFGDINQDSLIGPENVQNLIGVVNRLYNEYMTLVIDLNFRPTSSNATKDLALSVDGSKATTTVDGTAIQQVTRLKMNNSSKLTLQIMLGVMLLLMAVAVKMVKIRGTLPRSPLNIASAMGFLAGSTMCDPAENFIPPGAEFMSRKDLRRLFDGQHYSLGWWVRNSSREQSEVDLAKGGYSVAVSAVNPREVSKSSRFGIDVGYASEAERLLGGTEP